MLFYPRHCHLSPHRIGGIVAHDPASDAELEKALAKFMTVDEVAKEAGIPPGRLYWQVAHRKVVYVKASSVILIPRAEVKRLRAGKTAPLAAAILAAAELTSVLEKYADVSSASKMLNLTPRAIRTRIERGKIKTIKVAGRPLIPLTEIERVRYARFPGGKKPRGK